MEKLTHRELDKDRKGARGKKEKEKGD